MTKEQAIEEIRTELKQAGGDTEASIAELIQFSKTQGQKLPYGSDSYHAHQARHEAITTKSN